MWKRSSVLRNWPFFFICSTSIVSSTELYVCLVWRMCWAYFEVCLFVLMTWICCLYWVLNVHPVCPMYLNGHSLHFSWYTPLWLYMSLICSLDFRWFVYSIRSFEGYSNVCILKLFCDHSCLRAIICEGGPFCFLCLLWGFRHKVLLLVLNVLFVNSNCCFFSIFSIVFDS
jgi:hypothetical protein